MKWFSFFLKRRKSANVVMEVALVFLSSAVVYGYVQATGFYPDADAFYHAKMSLLTLGGPVREFPWLPLTVLGRKYADHHFLYHLAIAPFVAVGGLGWGLKLATVLLGAAAVSVFYFCLRRLSVAHSWFFTFLFASSGPVVQRLNLVKATAPALVIILLSWLAVRDNRRGWLFVLAFVYVWTHGSWPLIAVIAFLDLAIAIIASAGFKRPFWKGEGDELRELRSAAWRCATVLGGLAAGLVVNPFFPSNLLFYWEQLVHVALFGHGSGVVPGVEWLPFTPLELFRNSSSVFVAWLLLGLLWLFRSFWPEAAHKDRTSPGDRRFSAHLVLFAAATLGMSLLSRRHVEYFVPAAVLALGVLFTQFSRTLDWERFKVVACRAVGGRSVAVFLVAIFGSFFLYVAAKSVIVNRRLQETGYPVDYLSGAGEYLRHRVPAGEIVLHLEWEDFPALFWQSDLHAYVSGLDPNFLQRADAEKYGLLARLSCGDVAEISLDRVRREFGASYAVIRRNHPFLRVVSGDESSRLLYADHEVEIWFIGRD